MRPINRKKFILIVVLAVVMITGMIYGTVRIYDHFYGMKKINITQETAEGEYRLLYKGEYNGIAVKFDSDLYIDMNVLNEDWAGELLFYAEDADKVLYTTQTDHEEFTVGGDDFKEYNGKIYMRAQTAAAMFGAAYKANDTMHVVMLRQPVGNEGLLLERAYLLASPSDSERQYMAELKRGSTVEIFPCDTEGYYFAVNDEGYNGYLKESQVRVTKTTLSRKTPVTLKVEDGVLVDGKVSLAFQQFYSKDIYDSAYTEVVQSAYYVNVIAPTWFNLNQEGGIDDIASKDYTAWLHSQNKDVWAVFTNSFDDDITLNALKSTENRKKLCNQLLEYCQKYDLNGINVDFEGLSETTDRYFIEFLRELSVVLRTNNYVLSVDSMVPSPWTDFYQRDVMADVCDYVIVMAYDEHYDGSEEAGSTSSQTFTMRAVHEMIREGVPAEKLVLGMPWYTRLWKGIENLRSEAIGMDEAKRIVEDYELTESFDSKTGQNYAEGMVDETLFRIWLEDRTSVEWRLKMAIDSKLGGVAAWSLGFENDDVWQTYEIVWFQGNQ